MGTMTATAIFEPGARPPPPDELPSDDPSAGAPDVEADDWELVLCVFDEVGNVAGD